MAAPGGLTHDRARSRVQNLKSSLAQREASTHGFLYLVAIMDWFTRKVLAWRISNTLEADFCVEALYEAIHKFGPPEIMNTDQGSQFTSFA
jgi:transposase InsO family protein